MTLLWPESILAGCSLQRLIVLADLFVRIESHHGWTGSHVTEDCAFDAMLWRLGKVLRLSSTRYLDLIIFMLQLLLNGFTEQSWRWPTGSMARQI